MSFIFPGFNSFKLSALFLFLFFCGNHTGVAEVSLPKLVGDHMVLQKDKPLPIWGWAEPGEEVTILFQNQRISTQADNNGEWTITLAPVAAGGPYDMVITGKNSIRLKDILMGDVWVCSGQSNMEWRLGWLKENYAKEIASAKNFNIRQIEVEKQTSPIPLNDIRTSGWIISSPESVMDFTAVGYFFAKNLNEQYNVPIGLIYTTWGGTVAEAWVSSEALNSFPDFKDAIESLSKATSEEKRKAYEKELQEWNVNIKESMKKARTEEKALTGMKLNDKDWKTMVLPALWESEGLNDLDGIVWFRKEIIIPKDLAGKNMTISLGPVDDVDSTLFNGQFIGKTEQYNEFRKYDIPGKLVKAGKNVITIKVLDTGGGGGIYGKPEDMVLKASNKEIPLHGEWKYKIAVDFKGKPQDPNNPNEPTVLYNAMIAPLIPYAIKGTIWYQGESNTNRAQQYQSLFPALIKDWRSNWEQGDFPFLFVQLANFMQPKEEPTQSNWAELREAQLKTLSVPQTGMAVIIDIGEENDIHPKNKHDVGKRLALAARKIAYNEEVVHSGPIYESMEKEGNVIKIKFKDVGGGLTAKGNELKEFAIAGPDKKFYRATAIIENDEVVVSSDRVSDPVAVRYAWADNPEKANLYNKEGLPASPFRTDEE